MWGVDVWPLVRRERLALADQLADLTDDQWATRSLCEGWRVRDVAAHLVWLAEGSWRQMGRSAIRYGPATISGTMGKAARDEERLPTAELPDRLRAAADGRFKAPFLPPSVALAEVIVHGEDALRPLGLGRSFGADALIPCLDLYARIGLLVARNRRASKVRMIATDLDWSHGKGPETKAPALELLMFMAGR